MHEYLEAIVKPLLTDPEALRISHSTDDMGVLFTLDLARADMGSVIGKGGETANAIRSLMRVMGARNKARVSVKINEPAGRRGPKTVDEALETYHA